MASVIREKTARITNNPVGAVAGAVAGWYLVSKFAKVENKWLLIASALVGAWGGATIQSKMKASKGQPTKEIVVGTK